MADDLSHNAAARHDKGRDFPCVEMLGYQEGTLYSSAYVQADVCFLVLQLTPG